MSRPNFFIGIRLASNTLADSITKIQNHAITKAPNLLKCRMNVQKLHLTCFVLELDVSDVTKAVDCLLSYQTGLTQLCATDEKELTFNQLGHFSTRVLYTSPEECTTLQLLRRACKDMEQYFVQAGLLKEPAVEDWQPHCTVLKTSYDRKAGRGLKIKPDVYEGCEVYLRSNDLNTLNSVHSVDFGPDPAVEHATAAAEPTDSTVSTVFAGPIGIKVALSTIDLLSMQEVQEDGYYRSYAQIVF
jgi:hypothetical protein